MELPFKKLLLGPWGYIVGGIAVIIAFDFMTASDNGGTRESGDNNPLGVTGSGRESYPGIVGTNPPLLKFDKTQSGINAAAFVLHQYFVKDNVNTIDGIGNRWSGSAQDYATNIESFSGLPAGQTLNYWLDGINILNAISKCENGGGFQLPYTQLALGLLAGPNL